MASLQAFLTGGSDSSHKVGTLVIQFGCFFVFTVWWSPYADSTSSFISCLTFCSPGECGDETVCLSHSNNWLGWQRLTFCQSAVCPPWVWRVKPDLQLLFISYRATIIIVPPDISELAEFCNEKIQNGFWSHPVDAFCPTLRSHLTVGIAIPWSIAVPTSIENCTSASK